MTRSLRFGPRMRTESSSRSIRANGGGDIKINYKFMNKIVRALAHLFNGLRVRTLRKKVSRYETPRDRSLNHTPTLTLFSALFDKF